MQHHDIVTLFDYMYWVNHRLLATARALGDEQFRTTTATTTRDLRSTLVHELDVEWSWRLNLQHRLADDDKELAAADFPDLRSLTDRWDEDERIMQAWIAGLTDEALTQDVDSALTKDRHPLWHYLVHIFTHAQQQQADAATILTQLGHSPGEIGFVQWLHERPTPAAADPRASRDRPV